MKFKFSVIWWKIMFICTKEIARSKEDIKKLSKKHHQTFHNQSDLKFVNQLLKPQKLLDIITQVLSSSFSISILTNIISWKWTQDFKSNIQFQKKSPDLTLFNGNSSLQVDSLSPKSNIKFKRKVMLLKSESIPKILSITSSLIMESSNISRSQNKKKESESKLVSEKTILSPHSMILWSLNSSLMETQELKPSKKWKKLLKITK